MEPVFKKIYPNQPIPFKKWERIKTHVIHFAPLIFAEASKQWGGPYPATHLIHLIDVAYSSLPRLWKRISLVKFKNTERKPIAFWSSVCQAAWKKDEINWEFPLPRYVFTLCPKDAGAIALISEIGRKKLIPKLACDFPYPARASLGIQYLYGEAARYRLLNGEKVSLDPIMRVIRFDLALLHVTKWPSGSYKAATFKELISSNEFRQDQSNNLAEAIDHLSLQQAENLLTISKHYTGPLFQPVAFAQTLRTTANLTLPPLQKREDSPVDYWAFFAYLVGSEGEANGDPFYWIQKLIRTPYRDLVRQDLPLTIQD